jgi:hypothetical protein
LKVKHLCFAALRQAAAFENSPALREIFEVSRMNEFSTVVLKALRPLFKASTPLLKALRALLKPFTALFNALRALLKALRVFLNLSIPLFKALTALLKTHLFTN